MKYKILFILMLISSTIYSNTVVTAGGSLYDYQGKTSKKYGRYKVLTLKNHNIKTTFDLLLSKDQMKYIYKNSYNIYQEGISISDEMVLVLTYRYDLNSGFSGKVKSVWTESNQFEYSYGGLIKHFSMIKKLQYSTSLGYTRNESKNAFLEEIKSDFSECYQFNNEINFNHKKVGLENSITFFIRNNSDVKDNKLRNFYSGNFYYIYKSLVSYLNFETGDKYLLNSNDFNYLNFNRDKFNYSIAPGIKYRSKGLNDFWVVLYEYKISYYKDYDVKQHYLSLTKSW